MAEHISQPRTQDWHAFLQASDLSPPDQPLPNDLPDRPLVNQLIGHVRTHSPIPSRCSGLDAVTQSNLVDRLQKRVATQDSMPCRRHSFSSDGVCVSLYDMYVCGLRHPLRDLCELCAGHSRACRARVHLICRL
jgi:hypothetical protein